MPRLRDDAADCARGYRTTPWLPYLPGPHSSPGAADVRRVQGARNVFSRAPALPCGSFESETGFVSGKARGLMDLLQRQLASPEALLKVRIRPLPPSRAEAASCTHRFRTAKMLRHFCPVGVTLSWEEAHPGARASRPHKSSRSFSHLLHRNQPAAAPCLCFGRAHAVPAGRAVGCNIAGKLSGNRRDSMRAGRPRSRGCRPDGEVEGIRRATSLKAGLSPLGNSRLPASRAPAPRDWADPSRRTIN